MAVDSTGTTIPSGLDVYPPIAGGGGGGGGGITSVTPGDETIIIEGTPTDPTVRNNTTDILETSVNVTPGLWVNVYDSAGTPKIRLADASLGQGYQCDGFVVDTVAAGGTVKIYTDGMNTHVSGMVASEVWLGNAGLGTNTPPTTTGYISQQIGIATSATEVAFEPQPDILIAAPGTTESCGQMIAEIWNTPGSYSWTVPDDVEAGWLSMWGAGAGGKGAAALATTACCGGGSGESTEGMLIPVTPGANITIVVGTGGVGVSGTSGTNGGLSSFDRFVCRGGIAGTAQLVAATSGAGGGTRGAVASGLLGTAESGTYFGGGAAGNGGATSGNGTGGCGAPGIAVGAAAGLASGTAGGGGGGGSTMWGLAGAGGNGNANGISAASTSYGTGGGGAGGSNTASPTTGGNGAGGYVQFIYIG